MIQLKQKRFNLRVEHFMRKNKKDARVELKILEKNLKIEKYGLEVVPDSLKTSSAWDYIKLQTTINVNAGNMLVPALAVLQGGMGFYTAVWTTLLGALAAFVFVALMSIPGAKDGIPGQYAIRSMLGSLGSMLFSSPVRTVTSLYWFSVQAIGGAFLLTSLLQRAGLEVPFFLTSILLAVIMITIAFIGFQAMKTFASYFTPVLVLGILAMLYTYFQSGALPVHTEAPEASVIFFYASLAFVQYISGVSAASDLTRYAKTPLHGITGIFAGNGIGYFLTAVLGAWSASAAGEWNAFVVTSEMTENPFMLFIIVTAAVGSMLIINVNNAYTGGFSLLNSMPRLGRLRAALLFGSAAVLLSTMPEVVNNAETFINTLGIVVVPLSGVITAEFLIVQKGRLKPIKEKLNKKAAAVVLISSIGYYFMPASLSPGFLIFVLSFTAYIILARWKGSV